MRRWLALLALLGAQAQQQEQQQQQHPGAPRSSTQEQQQQQQLTAGSSAAPTHYLLGSRGGNSCPAGATAVLPEAHCRAAAQSVLPQGVAAGHTLQTVNASWAPPGCSVHSGDDWGAHYNTDPRGENDGTYQPVCAAAAHVAAVVGSSNNEAELPAVDCASTEADTHAVRCCSDVELAGYTQRDGCAAWATSNVSETLGLLSAWADLGCLADASYGEAVRACDKQVSLLSAPLQIPRVRVQQSEYLHQHRRAGGCARPMRCMAIAPKAQAATSTALEFGHRQARPAVSPYWPMHARFQPPRVAGRTRGRARHR